ncbi:hypothetical protein DYB37_013307 [Aphanomyces astaci]|uniref:Peptidase S9A N-terminal domain-containing protein n=1 Tax=Aphanomyces astaci TaxID=112090 RepID=A0A418EFK4_APHAT|nr:hypothetical protein DYB37_013307 [Aphanomyces astaci]
MQTNSSAFAALDKTTTVSLTPPVLEKRPKMVPYGKVPGENRGEQPMEPIIYLEDPYYYVRDDSRSNTEILDHLRAENVYTKAALSHLDGPQDELYKELLSHAYHIHCRQPRHDDGAEEILLDVNKLAEGHAHCGVRSVEVSPDDKLLAYTVEFTGFETYDIYIKDLTTNTINKAVEGCDGTIEWGRDAETLFYVTPDATRRRHKVWSHLVGAPQSADTTLFTEDDGLFEVSFLKSSSHRFLVIFTCSFLAYTKDTNNSTWHKTRLPMPEAIYTLDTAANDEYATTKYRYTYSSLTTPVQTVEYDFLSNKTVILKETPVPHYDRERLEATASDGTTIPISVVYRKDKKKAEGQPQALHLHGYGAYERSFGAWFWIISRRMYVKVDM